MDNYCFLLNNLGSPKWVWLTVSVGFVAPILLFVQTLSLLNKSHPMCSYVYVYTDMYIPGPVYGQKSQCSTIYVYVYTDMYIPGPLSLWPEEPM